MIADSYITRSPKDPPVLLDRAAVRHAIVLLHYQQTAQGPHASIEVAIDRSAPLFTRASTTPEATGWCKNRRGARMRGRSIWTQDATATRQDSLSSSEAIAGFQFVAARSMLYLNYGVAYSTESHYNPTSRIRIRCHVLKLSLLNVGQPSLGSSIITQMLITIVSPFTHHSPPSERHCARSQTGASDRSATPKDRQDFD